MSVGRIESLRCLGVLLCCVASSCARGADDPAPPPSRYEVTAAAPHALGAHAASVERDVTKLLPPPAEATSEPGDDAPEPPQPEEEPPDAGAAPARPEPGVSL